MTFNEECRLYYNFIKPHEALDDKTPSEVAGITVEGSNKWLTLMMNAIKYKKKIYDRNQNEM